MYLAVQFTGLDLMLWSRPTVLYLQHAHALAYLPCSRMFQSKSSVLKYFGDIVPLDSIQKYASSITSILTRCVKWLKVHSTLNILSLLPCLLLFGLITLWYKKKDNSRNPILGQAFYARATAEDPIGMSVWYFKSFADTNNLYHITSIHPVQRKSLTWKSNRETKLFYNWNDFALLLIWHLLPIWNKKNCQAIITRSSLMCLTD